MKKKKIVKKATKPSLRVLNRKPISYPRTADDVFVTQKMLYKVRDQILEKMDARFSKMEARFASIDSRFEDIDARFETIDARFAKMEAINFEMKSEIHEVKASLHRIELLVEEQNNRNKIVLDGLSQLFFRQEHLEKIVKSHFPNPES